MKQILMLILIIIFTCGAGYEGTLPDLQSDMSYKIKAKTARPAHQVAEKEPVLTEVPRENKEYVDIIIKKSRTSEYVKDIQPVIDLLEKFKSYIEDEKNIQMFNAIASNYIDHAYFIQTKYASRPERYYASYRALTSLAEDTKSVATFKSESVSYVKYLPYSSEGQKYSKENIKASEQELLKKIYDTLYVLKNLD
ncbi:MAG: hypothetical protein ACI37T_06790 [Candidatus Gastranaerophilaceae bacterium]